MIFLEKKHNFDLFFKNWNPEENEFVLLGSSKECVQLLRTIKLLLPKIPFKVKYIIDLKPEFYKDNISADEINKSTYEPLRNKDILNNFKCSVKSFEFFLKDKSNKKAIIASDEFYNEFRNKLLEKNFEEDIDFCKYRKFAAIIPHKAVNKTHIWRVDVLLTEKCTLNCTFCNMYMPHYDKPKHKNLDVIKNDLTSFFKKVDFVSTLHLVGGEPLLYPFVKDVIEFVGKNFRNKIDNVLLTTNGTLVPKDETLKSMNKFGVLVSISDYTDGINYKRKFQQVLKALEENEISYFTRKDLYWVDFGDPRKEIENNVEKNIKHFDSCTAPYRGLDKGKFYYCHLNTSAVLSKIFKENDNDFIEIKNISSAEDLLKFDLGYTKLGYITFCKNCNGCNTGIENPVNPADQGRRSAN